MADQMNIMCGMLYNMREVLAKSEKTALEAEKVASAAEVKMAVAELKVVEAEKRVAEAAVQSAEVAINKRPQNIKRSYANTVAKNHVIVKSGRDALTSEQVKCHVMACVDPVKNGFGVARIIKLKNGGVKINCPEEKDIDQIKALSESTSVSVREKTLRRPWIRLPRVNLHDDEEVVLDVMYQQNASLRQKFMDEEEFKKNVCPAVCEIEVQRQKNRGVGSVPRGTTSISFAARILPV